MSSEDQVRPYHAKTGSETADTLAEVLEHAAAKEEESRKRSTPKKQPRWKMPLGVNLGVFAVYLIIGQPDWVIMDPIEGPSAEVVDQNLRRAVWAVNNRVLTYQMTNGRLPQTLAEAGVDYAGVDYRVQGSREYQIVASEGDVVVNYDSTQDINAFLGDAGAGLGG